MRVRNEIGIHNLHPILEASGYVSSYTLVRRSSSESQEMLTIEVGRKLLFLKCSKQSEAKDRFRSEYEGLKALEKAGINIPANLNRGESGEYAWLLMEFVPNGSPNSTSEKELGRQIALLHTSQAAKYGWESDNFIATLPQFNASDHHWWRFYGQQRLLPQVEMAGTKLPEQLKKRIRTVVQFGNDVFPAEKPSLCHGDLWSGNVLHAENGKVYFIDPAIYVGHREMDMGMTLLFGGFGKSFYESYQTHFPLERNWLKRVPITTLYPLLVHVNLFGESYIQKLEAALRLTEMEVL